MNKELFARLFSDGHFKDFCAMVDELRKRECKIEIPLETVALLLAAEIDYVKGDSNLAMIHNPVKNFLNPSGREVSKTTPFYDYFVITGIMRIAENNVEQTASNSYRYIPLDITDYANAICKFDLCTCGYKPKIRFTLFINSLTGWVICDKCNLSVCSLFTHEADVFHGDAGIVYVNLQDGIKRLSDLWNKEVAKNESILHRTMRKLLSYGSNVCVNPILRDLHEKLYAYMVDNGIYRKPEYWNEPGYWDIATDKMMECPEPVQWVEDYLWENLPCKISV